MNFRMGYERKRTARKTAFEVFNDDTRRFCIRPGCENPELKGGDAAVRVGKGQYEHDFHNFADSRVEEFLILLGIVVEDFEDGRKLIMTVDGMRKDLCVMDDDQFIFFERMARKAAQMNAVVESSEK